MHWWLQIIYSVKTDKLVLKWRLRKGTKLRNGSYRNGKSASKCIQFASTFTESWTLSQTTSNTCSYDVSVSLFLFRHELFSPQPFFIFENRKTDPLKLVILIQMHGSGNFSALPFVFRVNLYNCDRLLLSFCLAIRCFSRHLFLSSEIAWQIL